MAYRRIRSEAILLRLVDFGESDRIVHLLCPEVGRLTAIAKGARRSVKRFGGSLDLCNLLRVQVEKRRPTSMARIDQAILVHPYLGLRERPARFALACYLVEIVDRMAPEEGPRADLEGIYHFLRSALRLIETHPVDRRLQVLLELRALSALGLRPELRHCVACGREPGPEPRVSFGVADGGVLCGACALRSEGRLEVHLGTLRALSQGLEMPLGGLVRIRMDPEALMEAKGLVTRFQRFHAGLDLRSEQVLEELLEPGRAEV